jgi:hypothetical protein
VVKPLRPLRPTLRIQRRQIVSAYQRFGGVGAGRALTVEQAIAEALAA